MKEILICGNSHVGALKLGFDQLRDRSDKPDKLFESMTIFPFGGGGNEVRSFSKVSNGELVFTFEGYRRNLTKFTGKRAFDSNPLYGFVLGTHASRLYKNPFWKTAAPSVIASKDFRPVSNALIDLMIKADQEHTIAFLENAKKVGLNFFVVSCPLPRRVHPCIERPGRKGVPAETVATLDARCKQLMSEWCAENDVAFVPSPKSTIGADGFLIDSYGSTANRKGSDKPDTHHANAEYGVLMMKKIADHCAEYLDRPQQRRAV
ncbi:MAG: hypothetical protein C0606_03810 [Hyphomicrobiales bacterium]|nr:MAG: hypothetical protein C0606_03810 [Hyphomicrobiales bacterium]